MTSEYQTIRPLVLQPLSREMHTLQDIYGVATIGVFGSVIRGEDTPESDVDILINYRLGYVTMQNVMALTRYLEELFDRNVDLVSEKWLSPYLRPYIEAEIVWL